MRITGTAIKLGAFALVLLACTAVIIVVFGQATGVFAMVSRLG
jgi:phospholipid/cholesterol/gamma-HCH transport system substrate-binding protein